MKKYAWIWVVAVFAFLGIVGSVIPQSAYAGDDPVTSLSMSLDAGADSICTNRLSLSHFAVQPTVDTYVKASYVGDGGTPANQIITTTDVLVGANKVYDIWTTNDRPYICCKPSASGAASYCKVLKYREF